MEPAGPFWKLSRRPPKKPLDDFDPELDAPVKGPLFPRPVFLALLAVFFVAVILMAGIAVPSALLMVHYRRIYSYISDENVFFAITFSLSFILGTPCAL